MTDSFPSPTKKGGTVIKPLHQILQRFPFGIRAAKRISRLVPVVTPPIRRYRFSLSRQLFSAFSGVVQEGVVKGLRLQPHPIWGDTDVGSQLLGFYEEEVLRAIEDSTDKTVLLKLGQSTAITFVVGHSRALSESRLRSKPHLLVKNVSQKMLH